MVKLGKILVVGDRVLIKPEKDLDKTNSGLYLPPGVSEKEKVQGGYIIKAGPGYAVSAPETDESWKENNGPKFIPLQAKEGDFALFLKKDGIEVELDGEKMIIVSHNAILLLIRDEDLLNY